MNIGRVSIGKVYKLWRRGFVLGISVDISDHIHLKEDEARTGIPATNELCITLEFLFWFVEVTVTRWGPGRKDQQRPEVHWNCR